MILSRRNIPWNIPWKVLKYSRIFSEEYFCGSHQYFRGSRKKVEFSTFFFEKFWVGHYLRIDATKKVGSQESFDFVQIGSYGFQSVWAYIRDSTNILSITGSQELIRFAFWGKMLFLPVNASWIYSDIFWKIAGLTDKVVNLFIERFLFNTEALPTLSHLCNLRQNEKEKARDFIHRWRSACNKMRDPISERHALSLILNNFSQPLRGLISTAPTRTFIELTEWAEWLEPSVENGVYEGFTFSKNNPQGEQKKKAHFTYSTNNNNSSRNQYKGQKKDYCYGSGSSSNKDQKGKPAPQYNKPPQQDQGPKLREKTKHEGWSYDRKFTPLDQTLEDVLEYMLSKEMVKLPRLANPLVPMGKWKDQFCKFHRTVGHNTENCFVLKNIVQDLIEKKLLVEGDEEEKMDILNQPFPPHTTTVVSAQPFLPHEHIKPCSAQDLQVQHQVSVLRQAAPGI